MTVTSRNLQVITGRAAREGARERVCFAQKPIAATKMAMRATQEPQRGGTTSCASRPSVGTDRTKCLISFKATGEQSIILSSVAAGELERLADREGQLQMEKHSRSGGPRVQIFSGIFFGDAENVGPM